MKVLTSIFASCALLLVLFSHQEKVAVSNHEKISYHVETKAAPYKRFASQQAEHWGNMNDHIQSVSPIQLTMEITHYTAFCNTGCIGITATGIDVGNTIYTKDGYPIVAVDPTIIPLHSDVIIDGIIYKAEDTGGDIKGNRLDILVETKEKARKLGRVMKNVWIVPNES